jgi:exopolysaccharide biosynthesis polyprenyl glycosylphosphotransferase
VDLMASGVVGRETSHAPTRDRAAASRRYAPGVAERRLLLFLGDQLALLLALVLSGTAAVAAARFGDLLDAIVAFFLAIAWWASVSAFDGYEIPRAANFRRSTVSVFAAFGLTFAAILIVGVFAPIFPRGFGQAAMFALLSILFLAAGRYAYASVFTRPAARRRVVVLGGEPEASEAVRFLERQADTEYAVLGQVRAGYGAGGEPVSLLTSQGMLSELVRRRAADEIVNAAPESDSVANEVVAALHRTHPDITVRNFSGLYEQLTGRVPIRYVCLHWRPVGESRATTPSLAMKRALDLFVSLVMIVVLSPLFLLIALAIRLDSRGPIIYRQEREGLHGRTFTMLKFRTMIDGAEGGDAIWERHEDPRRTRVGKFLRPLHLDEAPQLLNVLSGSMSLVGPRPERSQFVRQLEKVAPAYRLRMLVRPGITGWAQVRFGYARSLEESFEKLEYDLFYVKHWSPYLDLVIGLKTFAAFIRRNGNDAAPDSIMLESRGTTTVEGEGATAPASASASASVVP